MAFFGRPEDDAMTAFGKILAFLNLIFALLTAGLIGMVYLTRTNWHQAYTQIQAQSVAADASYKQLLQAEMDQVRAKEILVKQAVDEKAKVEKDLAAAKADVEQKVAQLAATQRTNDKESENVKATTAEIERRRNEVKQLNDTLQAREVRLRDLETQLSKTRDDYVQYKLKYDQLKERNENLLGLYEGASKELAAFKARGLTAPTGVVKALPTDEVRGTIKAIDGGLATISVGSDSGVNKDNLLYIYRLTPKPEYLGELVILSVTPFEAVGRIKPASRQTPVKAGDEVASQLTVKK
jgi:hypothetical protein